MQFRKKPVVIEATQWFKAGDHPAVVLKSAPNRYADPGIPWIDTLEGGHIVTPGDWIITGVKGEHYPCKPDIFATTYEAPDVSLTDEGKTPAHVPLTDEQLSAVMESVDFTHCPTKFARAIEQAHGINIAQAMQK